MTAAGHNLAMALRAAYWAMHRQADALLLRHGVTADQFVLLSLLAEQDAVTQQELVRRASSDANTVRAMLVRLEGQGLITRKPHPTDGRAWSVSLTSKGRRTNTQLRAASRAFWRKLVSATGPDGSDKLIQDLTRVAEVMSPPTSGEGDA
jgi:DNA-binding MarR family transcriptional regulator